MTPIELRSRREALGLNQTDLAQFLGVKQSAVSHWEMGRRPIPDGINGELNALEDQLESILEVTAEMLDATTDRPIELRVWPDDESFWAANPDHKPLPAVLYRVAMARARMEADDPNTTFLVGP